MYQNQTMSDSTPKIKSRLKIKGVLKQVSDAASIANQISDLVRAWLSSNLEAAPVDSQLQAVDCAYRIPDGDSIF